MVTVSKTKMKMKNWEKKTNRGVEVLKEFEDYEKLRGN